MKTIKSIKPTKNVEVGEIRRVSDKEADDGVRAGYWKYIPKSELKTQKVEEVREKYPANVEGSNEFNKANKTKKTKK
jgi:hypothetical protein